MVSLSQFRQLLTQTQGRNRNVGGRQIHKVPRELRLQNEDVYNPVMVSLGPYHHGKPELSRAEGFKFICLDWFSRRNEETKLQFYNQILEKIREIRSCYAEIEIVNLYNDEALALMMLLDACFIINFMENSLKRETNINITVTGAENRQNNIEDWLNFLGLASSIPFATRDMVLLENQVPYLVIKLLMSLFYDNAGERKKLLARFINWTISVNRRDKAFVIPGEDAGPPIHLLEACWRVLTLKEENDITPIDLEFNPLTNTRDLFYKNRSVMNLKAKGVHFRPSSSQSLKEISFKTRYLVRQDLHLPIRRISQLTPVLFSNLIAYEVSPSTKTEPVVLSYTNLMKSLIQAPEDVKELQENGILLNRFANDEQVVQVFREINTFGLARLDSFIVVKLAIEQHCRSKARTWFGDLIITRHHWFHCCICSSGSDFCADVLRHQPRKVNLLRDVMATIRVEYSSELFFKVKVISSFSC